MSINMEEFRMSQIIVRLKHYAGSVYFTAENFRIVGGPNPDKPPYSLYFDMTMNSEVIDVYFFFSKDKKRLEQLSADIQKHRLFCFDTESPGYAEEYHDTFIDLEKHCGAITGFVIDEEDRKQISEEYPDFVL